MRCFTHAYHSSVVRERMHSYSCSPMQLSGRVTSVRSARLALSSLRISGDSGGSSNSSALWISRHAVTEVLSAAQRSLACTSAFL